MKKRGSTLVLAVLMLSFFMAITLTMLTISRNKNQRSISKLKGSNLDTSLDVGTALAHYELHLATEYVTKGYLYETNGGVKDYRADNSDYKTPTNNINYTKKITIEGKEIVVPKNNEHYTGISLNNYNEFFVASWDPSEGEEIVVDSESLIRDDDVLKQPWIEEEKIKIEDGMTQVSSRTWGNNKGEKIKRLWEYPLASKVSVGGYRLTKINGKDKNGDSLTLPLSGSDMSTTTNTKIKLNYEKIVSIEDVEIKNNSINYSVDYEEKVKVRANGIDIVIEDEGGGSITVEKID